MVKETADKLVIRTDTRVALLSIGILLLISGLLILLLIRIHPLTFRDQLLPSLFSLQQVDNPATDSEIETISTNEASYRIANYVGQLMFIRERPIIMLAFISVVIGGLIMVGPFWGTRVTFDKIGQQINLKQRGWLLRSKVTQQPSSELYEVRVERDRMKNRPGKNFGVSLVFSHHEGAPLSRDYVHTKTVLLLSKRFQYDQQSAQAIVNRIRSFMTNA